MLSRKVLGYEEHKWGSRHHKVKAGATIYLFENIKQDLIYSWPMSAMQKGVSRVKNIHALANVTQLVEASS